jgi:hypothetical protein
MKFKKVLFIMKSNHIFIAIEINNDLWHKFFFLLYIHVYIYNAS